MKVHRFRFAIFTAATFCVLLDMSCSKGTAPKPEGNKETAKPTPSLPNIRVTPALQRRADTSNPGPNVAKKIASDTFGKGKASITVKGHPDGVNHSYWTEKVDIDGSGEPVQVDEVWDNHHKVLYLSKNRVFVCGNGQVADGSTLMTVYGKENTLQKPTGSGWWVAELDRGKCGVEEAGIYGCRFDANGNNTECGSAIVHSDEDDVLIIPLPGSTSGAPAQPPPPPAPSPDNQ